MKNICCTLLLLILFCKAASAQNFNFFKDLNTYKNQSVVCNGIWFNGHYFFTIAKDGLGNEIWKCDSTLTNPVLLKDINPGQASSDAYISGAVKYNGKLYFFARTEMNGLELWQTDGTEAGTVLFYESVPGAWSLSYLSIGVTNHTTPQLYFVRNDTGSYVSIYTYNYQARGIKKVYSEKKVVSVYSFGNKFLFYKGEPSSDYGEPWVTDGTPAGTFMLKEIDTIGTGTYNGSNSITSNSYNYFMSNIGGAVMFAADDRVNGRCLWRTDGTTAGTYLIKDFSYGTASGLENNITNIYTTLPNGNMMFAAKDTSNNSEPWITDGTTAGTFKLKEINPGIKSGLLYYVLSNSKHFNNQVFFGGYTDSLGYNPYVTDGTTAGTQLVSDLISGNSSLYFSFEDTLSNGIMMVAKDSVGTIKIFITDGTTVGTQLLATYPLMGANKPTFLKFGKVNGKVLYTIAYNVSSSGLYNQSFFAQSQTAYFTDGTIAGTVPANINFNFSLQASSTPKAFIKFNNEWYFAANDGKTGTEIWKTDGTVGGTYLFKDLCKSNVGYGFNSERFIELNGALFFIGSNDSSGTRKLLKFNGGSSLGFSVIDPSAPGHSIFSLYKSGNYLFYCKFQPVISTEPWISNGTSCSLRELNTANNCNTNNISLCGSNPSVMEERADRVIFKANESDGMRGVYTYSGGNYFPKLSPYYTTEPFTTNTNSYYVINNGQQICKGDISFGFVSGPSGIGNGIDTIYRIIAANDSFAFLVCRTGNNGNQLWKSNGISGGTGTISLVKTINPTGSAFEKYFYSSSNTPKTGFLGSSFFFFANDGVHGMELWKSDGTTAGTVMVKDINPTGSCRTGEGTYLVNNNLCYKIGNRIYFIANDGVHGDELWTSDGTPSGTFMTTDVNTGANGAFIQTNSLSYNVIMQALPFSATDTLALINLFNGITTETYYINKQKQTLELFDINKNFPDNYNLNQYVASSIAPDINLISAYSPEHGIELYKYSIAPPPNANLVCSINSGCTGNNLQFNYKIPYNTNTGNYSILQLSNASGVFSMPVNLDTLPLATGTVTTSIPLNTTPGNNYRVRIITTNPADTLADNGTDISIGSIPQITNCVSSITAYANATQCGANVGYNFSASGFPFGESEYSNVPGNFFNVGTTPVYFTAWNGCGADTCHFDVTVIDTISPGLVCPSNIVTTDTVVSYSATSTDNCSTTSIAFNPPSGSTFPIGTSVVTATASDNSGNSTSCQFTVTVTVLRDEENASALQTFNSNVVINPVPVKNKLELHYQLEYADAVVVSITDVTGTILYNTEYNGTSGNNSVLIDTKQFKNGIYLLHLSGSNFNVAKKLVVSK